MFRPDADLYKEAALLHTQTPFGFAEKAGIYLFAQKPVKSGKIRTQLSRMQPPFAPQNRRRIAKFLTVTRHKAKK
jgi:hypothetical protein